MFCQWGYSLFCLDKWFAFILHIFIHRICKNRNIEVDSVGTLNIHTCIFELSSSHSRYRTRPARPAWRSGTGPPPPWCGTGRGPTGARASRDTSSSSGTCRTASGTAPTTSSKTATTRYYSVFIDLHINRHQNLFIIVMLNILG